MESVISLFYEDDSVRELNSREQVLINGGWKKLFDLVIGYFFGKVLDSEIAQPDGWQDALPDPGEMACDRI